MEPTDEQLAKSGKEGDRKAFEELIDRYYVRVFYITRGILRDEERAGDATQETFLRMVEKIDQYNPDRRFFPWLYRIAANVSINQIRRSSRQATPLSPQDIAMMTACSEEDMVGGTEDAEKISSIIRGLPDEYRSVVTLKLLEDLETSDIARMLDISPNLVRVRLHRGIALIRRRFKIVMVNGNVIPFGAGEGACAQGSGK